MVITGPQGSITELELTMDTNENPENTDTTPEDGDVEGHRRAAKVDGTDDDVEGHRFQKPRVDGTDDDVEGHAVKPPRG